MKPIFFFAILFISNLVFSQELSEYDLKPYNDELKFKFIYENEALERERSLDALIIIFRHPNYENAQISIRNNPQLKEIKLFYANEEMLDFISKQKLPKLTHLFFEHYQDSELKIPILPSIEHLTIQSEELEQLDMSSSSLEKVFILDIQAPQLKTWKTDSSMPKLGLIHLNAPLLEVFPIEHMPNIGQFMYYCSFQEFPKNICSYEELKFISFTNYSPIVIEDCLREKLENAYVSDITVYDKIGGEVIEEIRSKDEE
jgi:hypothetical protein